MEAINLVEGEKIIAQLHLRKEEITGGALEDVWDEMVDAVEWIIKAIITIWDGVVWVINNIGLLIILCGAILVGTILLLLTLGKA